MALSFKLTKSAIQNTQDSIVITDETIYGTGNDARNIRGIVLSVYKVDISTNRVKETVVPYNSDYNVNNKWTSSVSKDGWVQYILASVPYFSYSVGYTVGKIIMNGIGIYRVTSGMPANTGWNTSSVTLITEDQLYLNIPIDGGLDSTTGVEFYIKDDLCVARIEDKIKNALIDVENSYLNGNSDEKDFYGSDFLDSMLQAAEANMLNQRPIESERVVQCIENYIISYD